VQRRLDKVEDPTGVLEHVARSRVAVLGHRD
jgi:hypothetical protein